MARNVSARYVLVILNVATGFFMVRFNMRHLGQDAYGLWMLAASITTYFTVLDLGYGTAVVKFVSEHRARKDVRGLNEILSTMAVVFAGLGAICYAVAILTALALPLLFNVTPDQVWVGRAVLLMIALQVALTFPFSIFGAVTFAFERSDINDVTAILFNVATAGVNVLVLWAGYGLVELVTATTVMRILPLWVFRRNAYRVFPQLEIRQAFFRRTRLRAVTGFSVYAAVAEWSGRLTYATGALYLGMFVGTAAVFIYSVAYRIAESLQMMTEQLHTFMMPWIVHRAVDGAVDRQRTLMVRATRLELGAAVGLCGVVTALAGAVIRAWLGPDADASIRVTQMLAMLVVLRAATDMPASVLQGTGHHRFLAGATAAAAVVNLIISLPLVLLWGVPGAAIGTVVSVALSTALVFPRCCRVVDLAVWDAVKQIVVPTLGPALVAVITVVALQRVIPAGLVPVLANLCVGGVVYAVMFLLFGVDREEREWLRAVYRRLPAVPR
jgi:O-antigen/teichoic acid export membrane protein